MRSKQQLLELIRSSLWGSEADINLFEKGVDWAEVLQLAKEQTLLGVVSAAIERLPLSLHPSRGDRLRLHQKVALNRIYRGHQVEILAEMIEMVKRAGVEKPVLLKGLGAGLNYPDPGLRQCGDIDLYVGDRNYIAVCEFIRKELSLKEEKNYSEHHFTFTFRGNIVEIHRYATAPNSVAFRSGEFIEWSMEQLEGEELREVSIEGVRVYLPPYNFDFIYIFYHTWRHFLTGGVGLRQMCDWACYTSALYNNIDREEIMRLVTLFRLERAVALFASIAVRALGVAPEKIFGYDKIDDQLYQSAMERIWSRGNFGYYNVDNQRRTKGVVARKYLGTIAMARDMKYLMRIDWRYALRFYSMSFVRSVRLAMKGL